MTPTLTLRQTIHPLNVARSHRARLSDSPYSARMADDHRRGWFIFLNGASTVEFEEPIFDVAALQRVDGTHLQIVARQVLMSQDQRQYLDARLQEVKGQVLIPPGTANIRLVLTGEIGQDRSHSRAAWEMALD